MNTKTQTKPHLGKNIHAIRTLRSIKQEAMAIAMNTSQSEISSIEKSAEIEESVLKRCALALGVSVETIRNFDESSAFYNINNFVENNTFNQSSVAIHQIFNPVEKIVELYERLLESEKEKNAFLLKELEK